jgi:hypothetical protein
MDANGQPPGASQTGTLQASVADSLRATSRAAREYLENAPNTPFTAQLYLGRCLAILNQEIDPFEGENGKPKTIKDMVLEFWEKLKVCESPSQLEEMRSMMEVSSQGSREGLLVGVTRFANALSDRAVQLGDLGLAAELVSREVTLWPPEHKMTEFSKLRKIFDVALDGGELAKRTFEPDHDVAIQIARRCILGEHPAEGFPDAAKDELSKKLLASLGRMNTASSQKAVEILRDTPFVGDVSKFLGERQIPAHGTIHTMVSPRVDPPKLGGRTMGE